MNGNTAGDERYENVNDEGPYRRRLDHDTGLIDSICLRCFVPVARTRDLSLLEIHEQAHRCFHWYDGEQAGSA